MYKPDQELVLSYLNGDPESLDILIKRHMRPVYGLAMRLVGNRPDAEDITQEVFVRVWKNIRKFDLQKPFKPWLGRITINASLDFLRTKKNISFSQFEGANRDNFLAEVIKDPALSTAETLSQNEIEQSLTAAVTQLSAADQKIFSLHYDNDLSFREIANRLAEPLNTVKSRYRRALLFLRRLLIKQP